jgi:esterase/lipase
MNAYILIHGKHSGSEYGADCSLYTLDSELKKQGHLVDFRTYPWGVKKVDDKFYWDTFEKGVPMIEEAIQNLKDAGASRIFLIGHSMGGNACLYYATQRSNFDGIILLAPAHNVHLYLFSQIHRWSLNLAKSLIDNGRGDELCHVADYDSTGSITVLNVSAKNYYSMLNPAGSANMQSNAKRIQSPLNVLAISGTRDFTQKEFGESVYKYIPKTDKSRYMTIDGDHSNICEQVDLITKWSNTI